MDTKTSLKNKAIVMGVSAGGLQALTSVLPSLEKDFPLPILIVQHMSKDFDSYLADHLQKICTLDVMFAEDKQPIEPSTVYIGPPGYHLLVERGFSLALSLEKQVNYSRPSIDVLFKSAAEAYLDSLIGVVMTGANSDGTKGLQRIKDLGGMTVVQAPETAEVPIMPQSAIDHIDVDYIVPLKKLGLFLNMQTTE